MFLRSFLIISSIFISGMGLFVFPTTTSADPATPKITSQAQHDGSTVYNYTSTCDNADALMTSAKNSGGAKNWLKANSKFKDEYITSKRGIIVSDGVSNIDRIYIWWHGIDGWNNSPEKMCNGTVSLCKHAKTIKDAGVNAAILTPITVNAGSGSQVLKQPEIDCFINEAREILKNEINVTGGDSAPILVSGHSGGGEFVMGYSKLYPTSQALFFDACYGNTCKKTAALSNVSHASFYARPGGKEAKGSKKGYDEAPDKTKFATLKSGVSHYGVVKYCFAEHVVGGLCENRVKEEKMLGVDPSGNPVGSGPASDPGTPPPPTEGCVCTGEASIAPAHVALLAVAGKEVEIEKGCTDELHGNYSNGACSSINFQISALSNTQCAQKSAAIAPTVISKYIGADASQALQDATTISTSCTWSPVPGGAGSAGAGTSGASGTGSGGATLVEASEPAKPLAIAPQLNIDIPGLEFTEVKGLAGGSTVNVPFIGQYVVGIYEYAIGVITIIALVVVIIAGARYTLAAGNAAAVKQAKEMVGGAVVGVLIAFGSYSILAIIDPGTLRYDPLGVQVVERIEIEFPDDDLPEEYAALAEKDVQEKIQAVALGEIPPQKGTFAQKKFYDKCGDPATMIAIADKFLAQPLCQGPCHCAPTIQRWLIQSGCDPAALKGAGLVRKMKGLLYAMTHPDGSPMYVERSGDDTANLSPGDILFIKNGHVGMYYGDGYTVDSGTGRQNQKTCFSDGCPRKIWDSYGTSKCTSCGLIKKHTPADWYWARGQLQKDLTSGNVTNNICYKIWHGTATTAERKVIGEKVQQKADKTSYAKTKAKYQALATTLLTGGTLTQADKKTALKFAPSYCTSCVGNQCIAKNKWKGRPKGSKKYGYDTYADYQPPSGT